MKRLIVALAALMCASAVYADGLPQPYRPRIAQPAPPVSSEFNWTGLYVGGGVGASFAGIEDIRSLGEYGFQEFTNHDRFAFGDLKIGYDYRFGTGMLLVGPYATWSPGFLVGRGDIDNIYNVGARAGLVFPDGWLLYTGLAWARVETNFSTADGWALPVGFEKSLGSRLTWGLEYKYTDTDNFNDNSITARLNVKLN